MPERAASANPPRSPRSVSTMTVLQYFLSASSCSSVLSTKPWKRKGVSVQGRSSSATYIPKRSSDTGTLLRTALGPFGPKIDCQLSHEFEWWSVSADGAVPIRVKICYHRPGDDRPYLRLHPGRCRRDYRVPADLQHRPSDPCRRAARGERRALERLQHRHPDRRDARRGVGIPRALLQGGFSALPQPARGLHPRR